MSGPAAAAGVGAKLAPKKLILARMILHKPIMRSRWNREKVVRTINYWPFLMTHAITLTTRCITIFAETLDALSDEEHPASLLIMLSKK
jgi:hypothetical protein